ncbi:MAG: 23S rRNA (adenine(2503)-C(2))-methyltransferase RlmN [Sedimentisphaerales bacterium]|nr:23S rRNA (adenine(2503)-C(2))-methyltransferase RlmN [Sedimentisphaerales bacterium]
MEKDLTCLTLEQLESLVVTLGGKRFLAKYLFSFIHGKNTQQIDDITPLPKAFRDKLIGQGYCIGRIQPADQLTDPDGTVKFVFALHDQNRIESVLLTDENDRKTLCISCQAGCRMGCTFCATGKLGFARNLTAGEIVEQVNQAVAICGKVNNVVYMGMGEPFDNYEATIDSIHILNHPDGHNIGQRHITVSTCGLPDSIRRFAGENLQVRLAVSLHAPDDDLRTKLMPVAGKYPIEQILRAVQGYQQHGGRRITMEYCMIEGINDADHHARSLARKLKGIHAAVNLIEYNPHSGCPFHPSSRNRIHQFRDRLAEAGIETMIRYKRGAGIKAACGQLGATQLEGLL